MVCAISKVLNVAKWQRDVVATEKRLSARNRRKAISRATKLRIRGLEITFR